MPALTRGLVALALVSAIACGSSDDKPDPGPPGKFSEIYPLIFPTTTNARCNFCHSLPANKTSNGGLHMGSDAATAYAALVDMPGTGACTNATLVVPGHPESSLFLQKVSPHPPCGNQMPVGGDALSADVLEMIRSWIAAGAKDD